MVYTLGIDIGSTTSKCVILEDGKTIRAKSLVKAGTRRFLDVMAGILQLDVDELGAYALKAEEPVRISSTCTVFAESEVISQLSKGVKLSDLIAGICNSVASRTAALAKRADVTEVNG